MTTVICPKCGTENPSDAVHCRKCRIIFKMALEQAEKNEVSARETEPDVTLNLRVIRDSWVVTNTIGFIISIALAGFLFFIILLFMASLGGFIINDYFAMSLSFGLGGVFFGYFQSKILAPIINRRIYWIGASAIIWALIQGTYIYLATGGWFEQLSISLVTGVGLIGVGLIIFLLVGLCQWLVLNPKINGTTLWNLSTIISYACVALIIIWISMQKIFFEGGYYGLEEMQQFPFWGFLLVAFIGVIALSLLTSIGLVHLVSKEKQV